jgi:hypothetical protein
MDKRLIHLLDSSDVSERERAIKAMARSGDPAYIGYLNAVIKTDPDTGLRSLAAKAVQYIKQQQGDQTPHTDEPHGRTTPKRVEVSAANERRAASMLDRAMELSTRHEDEAARELVMKAYQLDPNIRLDPYKRGIVGTVMGMGADQAFDVLDEQGVPAEKAKRKAKEKNDASSGEDVGWGTAILDLLIYGTVIAVSIIAIYLLLLQFGAPVLRQLAESAAVSAVESGDMEFNSAFNLDTVNQMVNGFISASTVFVLINAVVTALFNIVIVFIASVFIHFAAKILGGEGSLARLINKTVPIYTIYYVVALVASFVSIVILFIGAGQSFETSVGDDGMSASFSANAESLVAFSNSLNLVSALNFLLMVIFFVVIVGRIAAAYDFSWVRGCVTYILSMILMGIVGCGLMFLLTTVLASSLGGTFAMMPS